MTVREQLRSPAGRVVAGVLTLTVLAGVFVAGLLVGDDSDAVSTLESELAETQDTLDDAEDDLADAEASAADLSTAIADLEQKRKDLAGQLKAELDFEGELPTETSGAAPKADFAFGQAGLVGPLNFRPTAFEQTGSSGDEATYRATISVKNGTSEGIDPFCGDDGAAILDTAGSRYTGNSVLADDTANCGDSVQPGLTGDNFQMDFKMPASAEPALLELWGDFFIVDEGDAKTWSLP